jgi:hypothetical protein
MKPIRALFRSNEPRGTPQLHDDFQNWIGDPLRGRHHAVLDVRRGTLKVEHVKRPDGRGYRLVVRSQPRYASVPGIIARARERKRLLERETEFLRKFLIKTIAKNTYREWLSFSGFTANFFCEDDWSYEDNHRKFALYVLACFVDFFRPGQIDWRIPNDNDMQLVAKLLRIFADSRDVDEQKRLLRGLFDLKQDLNGVAVESTVGLSSKDQKLLLDCHSLGLTGEQRARRLRDEGFKGFGKSPLTKHKEDPDSMRALLSKWTRQILDK